MLDFYSMSTARLRAFHLLLMLSLLLTGAAGAGGTPLQPADCDHAAMAMDDAAPHAQPAGAAEPMHDCCEESATCSSDCRMSCAAPAAPAPQAAPLWWRPLGQRPSSPANDQV